MARKKTEKPKDKGGRPITITEEITEKICQYVGFGLPMPVAAAAAGVPTRTVQFWIKRGAEGDCPQEYQDFFDRVDQAIAKSENSLLTTIADASKTQWQAAAWILERRFSERWSRPEKRLELVGKGGGPIELAPVDLSEEQLRDLAEKYKTITGQEIDVLPALPEKSGDEKA